MFPNDTAATVANAAVLFQGGKFLLQNIRFTDKSLCGLICIYCNFTGDKFVSSDHARLWGMYLAKGTPRGHLSCDGQRRTIQNQRVCDFLDYIKGCMLSLLVKT